MTSPRRRCPAVSSTDLDKLIATGERSIRRGFAANDYKQMVLCLKELRLMRAAFGPQLPITRGLH